MSRVSWLRKWSTGVSKSEIGGGHGTKLIMEQESLQCSAMKPRKCPGQAASLLRATAPHQSHGDNKKGLTKMREDAMGEECTWRDLAPTQGPESHLCTSGGALTFPACQALLMVTGPSGESEVGLQGVLATKPLWHVGCHFLILYF